MAKFKPTETEQQPLLIRTPGNRIICITEYRDLGDRVAPITGYDVTSGYERLRAKDANAGVPLVSDELRPISAGEVAYRVAASVNDWSDSSWNDLSKEEQENWNHIGQGMKDYLNGDEVPYIY